ncbi:MAG: SpoIID/LytB domain-containing protein, partial [Ignavibacteriaceae bacterium]|nr:SpoIID/LytB domain-containing protein [Ignavibacteriaceae bacterium]
MFLIVSCSSTKRFPSDESKETVKKKTNLNFASVRVLLDESEATYHITNQSPMYLFNGEDNLAYIETGNLIECITQNDEIKLSIQNKIFIAESFILEPFENENTVSFNGQVYKGKLSLLKIGNSIGIVNHLKLEDYVKGVVTKEMPIGKNYENFESLKAFSICVRTYALNKILEGKLLYDLYDDTRDQVYGGVNAEHNLSNKAVEETDNKILTYNENIASIYYHSTCGGRTEAAHNIFTKKEIPYMNGIEDGISPNCKISPKFEWRESYSADDIISRLKKWSFIKNGKFRLRDVYIASRFSSGRVKEMVFELIDEYSDEIKISIYGNQIRSVIRTANNKRILWSTFFDISLIKNVIKIEGNGFGHGVGLCQYGAI